MRFREGPLDVQIAPVAGDQYQFKANASRIDLTTLTNPVDVIIMVGGDSGLAHVKAKLR